ncbi:hypothetical protein [Mesorhizobium sp.]|uniref:hypothetical protein n=1 Tax=Mesorhizobium sp. TaxID=1871066 RepID=UPI0011F93712|nr:hypothetical protein [Mesorhizobium sp.]TIN77481.1 MAG: hypothetical protein E5Y09_17815 [Mesorhizobium sp.]
MATRFQSSESRSFWAGIILWSILDFAIVLAIASLWNDWPGALVVAAAVTVAIWLAQMVLALYGFARYMAYFWFFERESRTKATVDQLAQLKMPAPNALYNDVDEYLLSAANDPSTSNDGRLFAGATLGILESTRKFGPTGVAISTAMVLEESLRRYSRMRMVQE